MLTFLFSPHEWHDCKMARVPVPSCCCFRALMVGAPAVHLTERCLWSEVRQICSQGHTQASGATVCPEASTLSGPHGAWQSGWSLWPSF